jgi:Fe(3+) dicitrate transport protein
MKARSPSFLALVGVLAPRFAYAQKAPEPSPPPPEPMAEVRIIGAPADALPKVPGSGTTLGAQDVSRAAPMDLAEMLRRVPGVLARQEAGGGQRMDIGIRGLDPGRSRRVLVLEDGIPVQINPYAEPDLYYSPPIERIRGIEVLKGSGSILFGPQTIGGVVNFRTLAPPHRETLTLDILTGTHGTVRALAGYGQSLWDDRVRYMVQVFHRRTEGVRDEQYRGTDAFAKVALDTASQSELTLKLGAHFDDSKSDDVGLTRAMFLQNPQRGLLSENNALRLQRYEVSLIHEQRWSEHTQFKTLAYAYTTRRFWRREDYRRAAFAGERYTRILGDVALPQGALYFQDRATLLDRTYDVAGLEPKFTYRLGAGALTHQLELGARFLAEGSRQSQAEGKSALSESGNLVQDEAHRTLAGATYAQYKLSVSDLLQTTAGLRLEYSAYRRTTFQTGQGSLAGADREGHSENLGVVPGLGVVLGEKRAHGFFGLHVGYAPPRLTSSISPRGESAELKAEQSLQYELGGRTNIKNRLRAEATLFGAAYQNQVVSSGAVSTSGATEAAAQVNGGATRTIGFESSASFLLGRWLGLPFDLDMGLRYAAIRATFLHGKDAGHLLPYAPEHAFGTTLDLMHEAGFGGQIAYQWTGAQYTDSANTRADDATGRLGQIQAYGSLDANLRYQHKRTGLSVRILGKNLLNEVRVQSRRPEGIFAGGVRQVFVTVRWESQ